MLKVLSLFSGIGAFEKALTNIGIDYDLVNYCEIDNHASKCYSTIHNVSEEKNLWDVAKIDETKLKDFDLLTHGSPCQDFSINGKQQGAEEGSGTKSSLLWETVRIVKYKKPKYVVWENVKNAMSKSHVHIVNKYIETLDQLGYKSSCKVLNSKKYGVPQNRDRLFVVSILNGEGFFEFPTEIPLKYSLGEVATFREKDDITDNFIRYYRENVNVDGDFFEYFDNLKINRTGVKNMKMYKFDQLNRVTMTDLNDNILSPTLSCRGVQNYCIKFYRNGRIYKPSPRMCFRLMGFTDEDFNKIENIGLDSDLWDRAGNSIVVDVIESIFKTLFIKELYKNNTYIIFTPHLESCIINS